MVRYWVVRAGSDIQGRVERDSFVGIGWAYVGKLSDLSQQDIAKKLARENPNQHPAKQGNLAGMLYRFASEIEEEHIVLTPITITRQVLIGKVVGPYLHDSEQEIERMSNRRAVEWLRTDVMRTDLSLPLQRSLNGNLTVFSLDSHADEITRIITGQGHQKVRKQQESAIGNSEKLSDGDYASTIDLSAKKRIRDILYSSFGSYEFEELVGSLLTAMGLEIEGRFRAGTDGGVDMTATSNLLGVGLERIVKVQVKQSLNKTGRPQVQQLAGNLIDLGKESGLFVALGGFTKEALSFENPNVRLLDGDAFIDLLLEYYEQLDEETQKRLPLRRVYLPAGA